MESTIPIKWVRFTSHSYGLNIMTKKVVKPRKKGSQARSKQTVEFIMEAAAQVLEEKGFEKATTDRIAEKAGVSIGTLYQYFPNKDAIFLEHRLRHVRAIESLFDGLLQLTPISEPLTSDMLKLLINVMIDHNLNTKQQHHAVEEALPKTDQLRQLEIEIQQQITEKATKFMSTIPNLRVTQFELAIPMMITMLEALIHWYLKKGDDEVDRVRFVDEMTDLLSRYLLV